MADATYAISGAWLRYAIASIVVIVVCYAELRHC